MNTNHQATLNQAIKLLQSLSTGQFQGGDTAFAEVPLPEYDTQIQNFYNHGKTL